MTPTRFRIFPDLYKDSVELMQIASALRQREGVEEASCVMATPANLAQLQDGGLSVEVDSHPSDLLVVVRGQTQACDEAIAAADDLLHAGAPTLRETASAFRMPITSIGQSTEATTSPVSAV